MSKATRKEKQALVPRLRFPEFRDAGEWADDSMSELYFFQPTNSYSRDKLNYIDGQVKNIHYGDIHTKFATLFDVTREYVPYVNSSESLERVKSESYCVEGDIVFADASEDMEDIGKSIEIVNVNNEKILSGLHTVLARQLSNKIIIGFGGYLFKSNMIREQIKREAQGAKVLGISSSRLSKIKICFPADKDEQQKVADCLSSLDGLITAQAEKLDALKTHKKGLMQQLFPREGETVPRLRFSEFRRAEEWESASLGDLGAFTGGGTPSKSESKYWQGDIPWISSSDISDESITEISITRFITMEAIENSATKIVPENSILLVSRVGVGKIAITISPVCTSQDFTNFTPNNDNLYFLAYYLKANNQALQSFCQGMAIKGFTKD